ncbi:hypothetical protein [Limnoglobus roseus]|uniref:Uncharacterized protein n=1 Tax=Limnoglobus roseus TaxID=2598579 RepID=A0A5C1AGE1_9BACT|nr:hypothetical protein [Limnoglobus roseus]QEL17705.1 hypothetical protein PX52LOC_04704 [Limnoglobus roseus]
MSDPKKSSAWAAFEARQRRERRAAHPPSWGWAKAVGVVVIGVGLGALAVYLFGPAAK